MDAFGAGEGLDELVEVFGEFSDQTIVHYDE